MNPLLPKENIEAILFMNNGYLVLMMSLDLVGDWSLDTLLLTIKQKNKANKHRPFRQLEGVYKDKPGTS